MLLSLIIRSQTSKLSVTSAQMSSGLDQIVPDGNCHFLLVLSSNFWWVFEQKLLKFLKVRSWKRLILVSEPDDAKLSGVFSLTTVNITPQWSATGWNPRRCGGVRSPATPTTQRWVLRLWYQQAVTPVQTDPRADFWWIHQWIKTDSCTAAISPHGNQQDSTQRSATEVSATKCT